MSAPLLVSAASMTFGNQRTDPRCTSSVPFVLIQDLTTAHSTPKDPYTILENLGNPQQNAIIAHNSEQYPWLELMVWAAGIQPTNDIIVRVFGVHDVTFALEPPTPAASVDRNRFLPQDISPALYAYDLYFRNLKHPVFACPLKELGAATYAAITFDHTVTLIESTNVISVKNKMLAPKTVYTGGAPYIVAMLDTVSDVDACLVGRFHN